MDDKTHERVAEILERLASMEGKIDMLVASEAYARKVVDELAERVAKTEAATKSAHKRLDSFGQTRKEDRESVRWVVGVGTTIAGTVCGLLTHFWGK